MGVGAIALLLLQWFLLKSVSLPGALSWEYMLLVLPLTIGVCYLVWLNEKIWTVMALLGHLFFMVAVKEGIGPNELAFSTITLFGLGVWFIKEMGIERRRIVNSGFDLLLFSFVIGSTITTLIANRLYHGNMLDYTREWFTTFDLLFYFPLKKMLQSRGDVKVLVGTFAAVGLVVGFNSILTYRERLVNSVYEYQITSSRVFANETTAMLFLLMFAVLFAYSQGVFGRLFSFTGMGLGALFLGISFARGAIVTGILGLFILAVILPFKRGRRVVVALFGSIIAIVLVLLVAMPTMVGNFSRAMEARIATVASAGKDQSFSARTIESAVVLRHVAQNPLLGYGYGVLFKHTDPLTHKTGMQGYIHNGYVRPLYKFGIPMALLVYLMMIYPLVRLAVRHPNRREEPFLWGIAAGGASYLLAVIVLNYSTEVFSVFWSVLNFAVVWAALEYVNTELKRREIVRLPDDPAVDPVVDIDRAELDGAAMAKGDG